jgi:hypothetical protein
MNLTTTEKPKKTKPTKRELKGLEIVNKALKDKEKYDLINGSQKSATTIVINDCDLRFGHYILALIAERKGYDLKKLKNGHAVAFFNCSKTGVKLFFNEKTMLYFRQSTPVNETVIHEIHKTVVNGGKANWDKATEKVLVPLLEKENRLAQKEDLKYRTNLN